MAWFFILAVFIGGDGAARRLDERIPRQPYDAYRVTDPLGRSIRFYLSESARSTKLPLVVYIQGSGSASHFRREGDAVRGATGHSSVSDVFAGRRHVLLVEKPGVSYLDDGSSPSASFHEEHTLDRWCAAIRAAILASSQLPQVDSSSLLVVGHSEGGLVAAKLAADVPGITHVAILAGGGGVQLFDLMLLTRAGEFYGTVSDSPEERERQLLEDWSKVMATPEASDQFFLGHSHRRWSSFHRTSPARELLRTRAKIFIAQGEKDRAVARASFDLLRAELLAVGREHRARLVIGADHSFAIVHPDGRREDGWREIFEAIREWSDQ